MPERNFGPVQRTHSKVDKSKKEFVQELKVGDIVAVKDDFYRITNLSLDKTKMSGSPVKYQNGEWQYDSKRNFKDFNKNEIQAKVFSREEFKARTDKNIAEQAHENNKQTNKDIFDSKNEEKEIQKEDLFLSQVVSEVFVSLQDMADKRGITLSLEGAEGKMQGVYRLCILIKANTSLGEGLALSCSEACLEVLTRFHKRICPHLL